MKTSLAVALSLFMGGSPSHNSLLDVENAAFVSFGVSTASGGGGGDPTSGLLPTDRSAWADWQRAGLQNMPFTATISATTMTVSGTPLGVLGIGQAIAGLGVTSGTTITGYGSGTGGGGTYTITPSQTVGSATTMTASGIPARSTLCTTAQAGVTMPYSPLGGGADDGPNIKTAANACPANSVVVLSLGTFTIKGTSTVFATTNGVTIRGSGPCAGILSFNFGTTNSGYGHSSQSSCTLVQATTGVEIGQQNGTIPGGYFVLGFGNQELGATTNLATDAVAGNATIQMVNTSGFSVGQFVDLAELSGFAWQPGGAPIGGPFSGGAAGTSWIWQSPTTPTPENQLSPPDYRITVRVQYPYCPDFSSIGSARGCTQTLTPAIPQFFCWEGNTDCDSYTTEIKQIASIGAGPCPGTSCTITFDDPVSISYRTSHTAHLGAVLGDSGSGAVVPVKYIGLENMTLQNAYNGGGTAIIGACAYCWIKNVETTVYSDQGSISVSGGFRDQIEGVYTHVCAYCAPGGAGYNWNLSVASTEILWTNSISMLGDKVMVARRGGNLSVFSYNYFDEGFCGGCGGGEGEVGMNASHWAGAHHDLFEGNWSFTASSDPVWGSTPFMTFFRNDVTGYRTAFHDYFSGNVLIDDINNVPGPNFNGATGMAIVLGEYWYSAVGNVLGTSGATSGWTFHTVYGATPNAVWNTGSSDGNDNPSNSGTAGDTEVWSDISGTWPAAANCIDGTDKCPLLRLSNYDYVTPGMADSTNPAVPSSFYLNGKPSFFLSGSGYTWPWVNSFGGSTSTRVIPGPTTSGCTSNVSGPCSGLPAKARIDNGTPFTQP